jgi:hypothetical protein
MKKRLKANDIDKMVETRTTSDMEADVSSQPFRSPSPTTEIQQRFHLLCLKIKKELYEQDPTHNINFQMSISELFEIANFLDVKEEDWETFCRVQLLHGTPMMPWVAALVASMQRKDVVMESMRERLSWLEQEVGSLRAQVNQSSKLANRSPSGAGSPERRQVPRPRRAKPSEPSPPPKILSSNNSKPNVPVAPSVLLQKPKRNPAKEKGQQRQGQGIATSPKQFRSAKDFLASKAGADRVAPPRTFNLSTNPTSGNKNTGQPAIVASQQWRQEQLLSLPKRIDGEPDFDTHVPAARNWNVEYSKSLRKYD